MTLCKLAFLACMVSLVLWPSQSEGFSVSMKCKAPMLMSKLKSLENKVDKLLTMVAKCKGGCCGQHCPKSWSYYRGSCYKAKTSKATWQDSRKYCQSIGGDLATIKSAQENSFVANLARSKGKTPYVWLGLFRDSSNNFHWVDGSSLAGQYTNWSTGEPNFATENCGTFYSGANLFAKWNNDFCTHNRFAVCEKAAVH